MNREEALRMITNIRREIRNFEKKMKDIPNEHRNEYRIWIRRKRSTLKQLESKYDR